jgi:hypothetical protein
MFLSRGKWQMACEITPCRDDPCILKRSTRRCSLKDGTKTLNEDPKPTLRRRAWVETVVAGITSVLCVITPLWPDWIEAISGWDPDHGDGTVEWAIVMALLLITIVMIVMARRTWNRLRLADCA